jgi:putative radical SAM enzyme (TIGR03279 family)
MRRPNEGGIVDAVRPGSLAEEIGLRRGDRITAIDGNALRDAVDFQFQAADELIELEIVRNGEAELVQISKHPDESIGVSFEDAAFDGVRICNNACFFCFLKGNPKGMRKTLYVKDDDYRLSFFHGNFVTLTNLTNDDWQRIGEQRLSPLNVSVHATDVALRRYLLGNKAAPDICAQLRRLGDLGIEVNTQVVLCPGVNDGDALDRTIDDLAAIYPTVRTISVVPVGATMTAEERIARGAHAEEIEGCTPGQARDVIAQVAPFQRRYRSERGTTLVYLADEFYLVGDAPLPPTSQYDGFPQFENGIGMARSLLEDWRKASPRIVLREPPVSRLTFVCATLIGRTLERLASEFTRVTGINASVLCVDNEFFGPRVNVSGLLTGADVARALAGRDLGDLAVLPRYALDYTGGRFLDDVTPAELQARVGAPLAFASTMSDVLQIVTEGLQSEPAGATPAATTNGKAWVDFASIR